MEKYKKGGYTILDLESSTIYADSVKALDSNKPVVVYDGTNKPYFADSISLSGTSVVITKGGKTITIANDNTITNVGDIQNHLYNTYFELEDKNNGQTYSISFTSTIKYTTINDIYNFIKNCYSNDLYYPIFMYDYNKDLTELIKGFSNDIDNVQIEGIDSTYGNTFDMSVLTMEDVTITQLF